MAQAVVLVTPPRVPCYKLAAKFGREDIVERFLASGRSGFYLKVVQEGEVGAADPIELMSRDGRAVTVADLACIMAQAPIATCYSVRRGWRPYRKVGALVFSSRSNGFNASP